MVVLVGSNELCVCVCLSVSMSADVDVFLCFINGSTVTAGSQFIRSTE